MVFYYNNLLCVLRLSIHIYIMTLTEAGEPSELAIKLLNVEGAAQLRCRLSRTHDQTFQ